MEARRGALETQEDWAKDVLVFLGLLQRRERD